MTWNSTMALTLGSNGVHEGDIELNGGIDFAIGVRDQVNRCKLNWTVALTLGQRVT